MGATSEIHRRKNESHDAGPYRLSARLTAAKGLLATGFTLKPGGVQRKSFEETKASLVTKQRLNLEYPSLQDFELLQTLGMVCWNKTFMLFTTKPANLLRFQQQNAMQALAHLAESGWSEAVPQELTWH